MKTTKTITKTYEVENITCDACGKKFDKLDKKYNLPYFTVYYSAKYGEKIEDDHDNFWLAPNIDLCVTCSEKLRKELLKELSLLCEKYKNLESVRRVIVNSTEDK